MFCGSIFTSSESGILEPPADRDGAPQGGVELGQLVAADLAGRVDAGAGLVDDDVGELGEQGVGGVRLRRRRRGGGADGCLAEAARATTPTSPGRRACPGAEAGHPVPAAPGPLDVASLAAAASIRRPAQRASTSADGTGRWSPVGAGSADIGARSAAGR